MVNNVMRTLKPTYFAPILTLLMAYGLASAQTKPSISPEALKQSSANVVEASREYEARSEELVRIQETAVNQATAKLDELRQLVADGLVAKAELEESEQSLATLRGQLEMTRKQILDSREMVTRIRAEEAKAQAAAVSARTTGK